MVWRQASASPHSTGLLANEKDPRPIRDESQHLPRYHPATCHAAGTQSGTASGLYPRPCNGGRGRRPYWRLGVFRLRLRRDFRPGPPPRLTPTRDRFRRMTSLLVSINACDCSIVRIMPYATIAVNDPATSRTRNAHGGGGRPHQTLSRGLWFRRARPAFSSLSPSTARRSGRSRAGCRP